MHAHKHIHKDTSTHTHRHTYKLRHFVNYTKSAVTRNMDKSSPSHHWRAPVGQHSSLKNRLQNNAASPRISDPLQRNLTGAALSPRRCWGTDWNSFFQSVKVDNNNNTTSVLTLSCQSQYLQIYFSSTELKFFISLRTNQNHVFNKSKKKHNKTVTYPTYLCNILILFQLLLSVLN